MDEMDARIARMSAEEHRFIIKTLTTAKLLNERNGQNVAAAEGDQRISAIVAFGKVTKEEVAAIQEEVREDIVTTEAFLNSFGDNPTYFLN